MRAYLRFLNPIYTLGYVVARIRRAMLEKRMERQFAKWDRLRNEGN